MNSLTAASPPCLRRGVVRRAGDCYAPPDAILALVGAREVHVSLLLNPDPCGRRFVNSLRGLRRSPLPNRSPTRGEGPRARVVLEPPIPFAGVRDIAHRADVRM